MKSKFILLILLSILLFSCRTYRELQNEVEEYSRMYSESDEQLKKYKKINENYVDSLKSLSSIVESLKIQYDKASKENQELEESNSKLITSVEYYESGAIKSTYNEQSISSITNKYNKLIEENSELNHQLQSISELNRVLDSKLLVLDSINNSNKSKLDSISTSNITTKEVTKNTIFNYLWIILVISLLINILYIFKKFLINLPYINLIYKLLP